MRRFSLQEFHPPIPTVFDFRPPLGDGDGYNGLELLLMSFSGCNGTTILYLLRSMGKEISGLKVNVKSLRRDQLPIKFEKIFVEFVVSSKDTSDSDIQKAILLAEKSVCPVWQMIKVNVEVITEYRIVP